MLEGGGAGAGMQEQGGAPNTYIVDSDGHAEHSEQFAGFA